jgi:hypothetical protein
MNILECCREHATKFYCNFLSAAEQPIANKLFELSEQCDNNADQQLYFEAMQRFGDHFAHIEASFRSELERNYQQFVATGNQAASHKPKFDPENLSLVQREQLEDELVVTVIVSKANARNTEPLWKLNRRLAVLRGGDEVTDENNPFAPAQVFEAMHRALANLEIVNKARLTIFKQLGKLFILNVGKELDALNELLAGRSILPNLRFVIIKQPDGASTVQASLQPTDSEPEVGAATHQQQLFNLIEALQHTEGSVQSTAAGVSYGPLETAGDGGAESFAAVDYALALTAIQQSQEALYSAATNRPLDTTLVEQRLVEQLSKQSNSSGRHKMTRDAVNTVDLVGMIFRYVFDDPALPDCVKAILSHLHTPYLKLALIDNTFVDNHEHSARVLLNLMAELGGQWVQDEVIDRCCLSLARQ